MGWSFPIGRLFGSELRVHATFFLLLAWIGASAWAAGGPSAALWNVVFVLALFACVVAHEFGHALMARRFGIRTPDITLLPIGGLARLERMPEKPGQEIAVAVAGPMVNVAIWLIMVGVFGVSAGASALDGPLGNPGAFLSQLAAVNLMLALFNALPAFPMDGGRVLRAVLGLFTDRVTATRLAAQAGQVIAFGLGIAGLLSGNLVLILVAFFVFVAAGAESSDVAMRAVSRTMRARDAMITTYEPLRPDDTLGTAAQALIRTTQHEFPVLDGDGTLAGFLTRAALFQAMAEHRGGEAVASAMTTEVPVLPLDAPLERVLDALAHGAEAVAIASHGGDFLGYVTRENIGELMVLRGQR